MSSRSPAGPVTFQAPPRTFPELELAARHVDPARLEPGTRLAPIKRLVLRMLRIYSSGQIQFNGAVLRVLNAWNDRLARLADETRETIRARTSALGDRLYAVETLCRDLEADTAESQDSAERNERELTRQRESLDSLLKQLAGLRADMDRSAQRSREVDHRLRELSSDPELIFPPGAYHQFEEQFRGTRDEIRARQAFYIPFLQKAAERVGPSARFLDLGCGRGELVELARAEGLNMTGADLDEGMVAESRGRGLPVERQDLFESLTSAPERSLAGITALQVIEHMSYPAIRLFLELARGRLAPGGCLIVETINPTSVHAMRFFWTDPTHRQPIPDPTCRFLFNAVGFLDVEVHALHTVDEETVRALAPDGSKLRPIADYLLGYQDYAVVGWVR